MRLFHMYHSIKRPESGFTLIELMIAVTVGLILLTAVLGTFVTMIRSDNDNLKAIRLNQQLRATMSLIARDLKRSGYSGNNTAAIQIFSGAANVFQQLRVDKTPALNCTQNPDATHPPLGCPCVVYTYDEDNDGITDGSERFGFRLTAGGVIESRINDVLCDDPGVWNPVTDRNLVEITDFSVSDPDLVGDLVGSPPVEETNLPGKTVAGITTHRITISITGRLDRDNTVVRTITETVETRNAEH